MRMRTVMNWHIMAIWHDQLGMTNDTVPLAYYVVHVLTCLVRAHITGYVHESVAKTVLRFLIAVSIVSMPIDGKKAVTGS